MAKFVVQTKDFSDTVQGIVARAQNAKPALRAWGQHMVGSVKRNFQDQGRPNAWRPLKVNTLIARYLRGKEPKEKEGGRFSANPLLYKQSKGRISAGDVGAISTVAGMARSAKTGRVLRSRHGGLNKIAPAGMVFRKPAVRAILSGKILLDTGRLRKSITSQVTSGQQVEIGTNVKYAGPHQFGYEKNKIPARPFLVIQADDEEEFTQLLTEWLRGEWETR